MTDQEAAAIFTAWAMGLGFGFAFWLAGAYIAWDYQGVHWNSDVGPRGRMLRALFWPVAVAWMGLGAVRHVVRRIYLALVHDREPDR